MSKENKQHMTIKWRDMVVADNNVSANQASLKEKATLVGRTGLMMLSVGTGAWRVRNSMNTIARVLGVSCSADIGLVSIQYTCIENNETYTQSLSLPNTGVNTDKLMELEMFMSDFSNLAGSYSVGQLHEMLDHIQNKKLNYNALAAGLAAAAACGAFAFLLGGGLTEMICTFFGAGAGNYVRRKMTDKKISLFANVSVSVAVSCVMYFIMIITLQVFLKVSNVHQAGYICAMLFVIPGFPLITGGIDMAKLDMRSGLERTAYALLVITVAAMTGWVTAMLFNFRPADFPKLEINAKLLLFFRMAASFMGVFNFSLMFNSTKKMAFTAGMIGMLTNTLRLELIDYCGIPIGFAAFIGAFMTGCIASVVKRKIGFPRISITVPAIVIMVPGLYMYRGIYHIALSNIGDGALWLTKAFLVVIALPIGLVAARLCTDKNFRHCT